MLYNSDNLTSVICLHTVCSIWPTDRTISGATLLVRVDLGEIAMKRYSALLSDDLMFYLGHHNTKAHELQTDNPTPHKCQPILNILFLSFGCIIWHINCMGYLMPNPIYIYIYMCVCVCVCVCVSVCIIYKRIVCG